MRWGHSSGFTPQSCTLDLFACLWTWENLNNSKYRPEEDTRTEGLVWVRALSSSHVVTVPPSLRGLCATLGEQCGGRGHLPTVFDSAVSTLWGGGRLAFLHGAVGSSRRGEAAAVRGRKALRDVAQSCWRGARDLVLSPPPASLLDWQCSYIARHQLSCGERATHAERAERRPGLVSCVRC